MAEIQDVKIYWLKPVRSLQKFQLFICLLGVFRNCVYACSYTGTNAWFFKII